ncbi:unnamed protein product [Meganyctiphanes norvegica]|uniref:G-protein coupled receptor 143 n=1 Tax=Meganyctiphanes norvegica TaxID=48144 RepID=A0AAV2RK70_MEGNR
MASPTIESLCCISSMNPFTKEFLSDFHTIPYNSVSVVSAILGIAGAVYQVLPRSSPVYSQRRTFRTRGRVIIKWLAMADLMASIGILIRSASWLGDDTFGSKPDDSKLGQILCVITSGWIHYFYTATYFWTFTYALDVKLVMQNKSINHRIYHLICWTVPLIMCLVGLLFLYLPDLNCHDSPSPYLTFLPNYMSTFIPILFVMISNPILYYIAFAKVEEQITSARGRFTDSERHIVDTLRRKFLMINVVFYICWLPNILNGIILWSDWENLPKITLFVIWYLMAVLNPLQAVFNSVVYRSWAPGSTILWPKWLTKICCCTNYHQWDDSIPRDDDDTAQGAEQMPVTRPGESPALRSVPRSVLMKLAHERTPLIPAGLEDTTSGEEEYTEAIKRMKETPQLYFTRGDDTRI